MLVSNTSLLLEVDGDADDGGEVDEAKPDNENDENDNDNDNDENDCQIAKRKKVKVDSHCHNI